MQTNKEIGKIQSNTPLFLAKALELFIEDITNLSVEEARKYKDNKITPSHIKEVIENQDKFNFLKQTVAKVQEIDKSKKEGTKRKQKEKEKSIIPQKKAQPANKDEDFTVKKKKAVTRSQMKAKGGSDQFDKMIGIDSDDEEEKKGE